MRNYLNRNKAQDKSAAATVPPKKLKIGDKAADGWIYAGKSPDTHKPMFVAPEDAGVMSFVDASTKAFKAEKKAKSEIRLPSERELNRIFNCKAKIGGFNENPNEWPEAWYFTSTYCGPFHDCVRLQDFSSGKRDVGSWNNRRNVRLVRS